MRRKTFDVELSRDNGRWLAVLRGLGDGRGTEVRRCDKHFDELEVEVYDLICRLTGLEPEAVEIRWQGRCPPSG